jgi:exonuclease I
MEKLTHAVTSAERVYPPSEHVEQQIYGAGFLSDSDRDLCSQFHSRRWEERLRLVERFNDQRLRRLGRRLIYFEAPHLIDETERRAIGRAKLKSFFRTAALALLHIECLAPVVEREDIAALSNFRSCCSVKELRYWPRRSFLSIHRLGTFRRVFSVPELTSSLDVKLNLSLRLR